MPFLNLKKNLRSLKLKPILISVTLIGGLMIGVGVNRFLSKSEDPTILPPPAFGKPSQVEPEKTETIPSPKNMAAKQASLLEEGNPTALSAKPNSLMSGSGIEGSLFRLKSYVISLEEKNSFLKEKIELLNNLVEAKEKEVSRAYDLNSSLKEELAKITQMQGSLKSSADEKLNNLTSQLSQKDAAISSLNTLKVDLENQIVELKNKLAEISGQLKPSLDAELAKAKERLKEEVDINDKLSRDLAQLTSSLSDKEKEKQEVLRELQSTKVSRNSLELEVEKYKNSRADFENKINQLNSRINELTSSYEDAKKSSLELSGQMDKKESQLKEKENQVSSIKESLERANKEKETLGTTASEKDKSIKELKDKMNNLQTQLEVLQKELGAEREKYAKASGELQEASALNNTLKAKLRNIYTELELLRIETKRSSSSLQKQNRVSSGLNEVEEKRN